MNISIADIENFTPSPVKTPTRSAFKFQSPSSRGLSPLKIDDNGGFLPSVEFRKLERALSDALISNKELLKARDFNENELRCKTNQLKNKNHKINELIQENSYLVKELKKEREYNEDEFNSWTEKKVELESKIRSLNDILLKRIENEELESTREIDESHNEEQFEFLKNEIEVLNKRIYGLQRENELEVQSKMMIIDELELIKSKFNNLNSDYEQLKFDYEELVSEYSILQIGETENEDENESSTPTIDNDGVIINDGLQLPKIRQLSSCTTNTEASVINQMRSLSRVIRDTESQSQKNKYSKIIMNYEFAIQSLKLQNEKLHSYIGFITQKIQNKRVNSEPGCSTIENIEYSDEINIKNAKQNLKTIIRSVSALPLRSTNNTISKDLSYLDLDNNDLNISNQSMNNNDDTNDSFCESIAYSTDYNQGSVKNLEFDSDFSFDGGEEEEEDNDEMEEEEEEGDDEGEGGGEIDEMDNEPVMGISNQGLDKKKYSSTDSLNVSFKMNFAPKLKLRKSKMLKEPSKKHVQKITRLPSDMNIKGQTFGGEEYYHERNMSNKGSMKSLSKHLSNSQLIHSFTEACGLNEDEFEILEDGPPISDEEVEEDQRITGNELDDGKQFPIFTHIIEEEEEEEDFDKQRNYPSLSSDDEDICVSISNKEINEFKLLWKSCFCPRHSLIQCLCHQRQLIDVNLLQFASNPVYKLQNRIKSKNVPLRYHKRVDLVNNGIKGITSGELIEENDISFVD